MAFSIEDGRGHQGKDASLISTICSEGPQGGGGLEEGGV